MIHREKNSFEELFKDKRYIRVKNYLYNYLLRKRAIRKCLKDDHCELMLEVGSGISPLVTDISNIVYSDISFEAISLLKQDLRPGYYVVADGTHLPFKSSTFSHVICSEVLEHLQNDRQAIDEIRHTLKKPQGCLIVTVPHRRRYFGCDDRYVKHYRRYEIGDIKERLLAAGLQPVRIQKVLGPLEKITMILAVSLFSFISRGKPAKSASGKISGSMLVVLFIWLFKWINQLYKGYVWLDAKIMPMSMATVILIKSTVAGK